MTARLFLHIGPPKSGTTSLQLALQNAHSDWFRYLGTFQPRSTRPGNAATTLHRIASGAIPFENVDATAMREEISEALGAGQHAVMSEEMFLVWQEQASIEDKLLRLSQFLRGIPVTVLVTLRSPVSALPSLYQELHAGLPLSLKLSFSQFCASERASCYDYRRVVALLERHDFDAIRFIDFRSITDGTLSYRDLFGEHASSTDVLMLERANAGSVDREGARQLPPVTAKTLGRNKHLRGFLDRSGIRSLASYRWIVSRLERVQLQRGGHRKLVVPTELGKSLEEGFATFRRGL